MAPLAPEPVALQAHNRAAAGTLRDAAPCRRCSTRHPPCRPCAQQTSPAPGPGQPVHYRQGGIRARAGQESRARGHTRAARTQATHRARPAKAALRRPALLSMVFAVARIDDVSFTLTAPRGPARSHQGSWAVAGGWQPHSSLGRGMGDLLQKWLQERLQAQFATDLFMAEAVAASLLACSSEAEARDTVDNFLGKHDSTPALIAELFQRLRGKAGGAAPPASIVEADGRQAHAYVKPPREAAKPAAERQQQCGDTAEARKAGKGQRQQQRRPADVLAAADEARPLWRGRVVNCLACGKVHDCRGDEAELPASLVNFLVSNVCTYCGAAVLDGPDAAVSASQSENEAASAAAAAHLRLVTFDREGVGRSKLVDDQMDYVTAEEANPWLTPEERTAMKAAAAAAEAAAEEQARRRRTTVTIDLIGRRVLQPSQEDEDARRDEDAARLEQAQAADAAAAATVGEYAFGGGRNAQLASDTAQRLRAQVAAGGDDDTQPLRMMANPGAPRTPLFVATGRRQ